MTTTTQLHGFAAYTLKATVQDLVIDYLGDYADDYDLDGLTAAFRDAVNEQLGDTGISLIGDDFYSTVPVVDDATERIRAAIETADLDELAPQYDRSPE